MAKKRHHHLGSEFYAGMDPRRSQERQDAGMLSEDHKCPANLPQHAIMREYPKVHGYTPDNLDDSLRGVDRQIDADNSGKLRNFRPHKY